MELYIILLLKYLMLFFSEDQCEIETIYGVKNLYSIEKLMIDGQIYDGSDVKALQKMSLDQGLYEVSVTKKDQDMYEVDYENLIIETRYCYEYSYSQDAIIKWNGYGGTLIFMD